MPHPQGWVSYGQELLVVLQESGERLSPVFHLDVHPLQGFGHPELVRARLAGRYMDALADGLTNPFLNGGVLGRELCGRTPDDERDPVPPALAKGIDPDNPRYLRKVTRTF